MRSREPAGIPLAHCKSRQNIRPCYSPHMIKRRGLSTLLSQPQPFPSPTTRSASKKLARMTTRAPGFALCPQGALPWMEEREREASPSCSGLESSVLESVSQNICSTEPRHIKQPLKMHCCLLQYIAITWRVLLISKKLTQRQSCFLNYH